MEYTQFNGYLKLFLGEYIEKNLYVLCILTEVKLNDLTDSSNLEIKSCDLRISDNITNGHKENEEFETFKGLKDWDKLSKLLLHAGYYYDRNNMSTFCQADLYIAKRCLPLQYFNSLKQPKEHKVDIYQPPHIMALKYDKNKVYKEMLNNKDFAEDNLSFNLSRHKKSDKDNDSSILNKYGRYKYTLFSRFDEGIEMDSESWYSCTPEIIAKHIAQRMPFTVILDAFCGSGGNLIQFVLNGAKVLAVDNQASKLALAQHNLSIYLNSQSSPTVTTYKQADFILADFESVINRFRQNSLPNHDRKRNSSHRSSTDYWSDIRESVDAIFLDPPWGGVHYERSLAFDLDVLNFNLAAIYRQSLRVTPNVVFKFPRNSNICQLTASHIAYISVPLRGHSTSNRPKKRDFRTTIFKMNETWHGSYLFCIC
ncbi:trimethylguanosine synthase-like isoform X2 [Gordionus sp. m RMFG-2023]|uniref:trimethylguanosine synthase-like isoform X2 n=1 Tax=Gordionus sp. m RMFG-2023 TaxID=3053472 RepID=UPI0031FE043E